MPVPLRYFPRRRPTLGGARCAVAPALGLRAGTHQCGTEGRDVSELSPVTTSLLPQAEPAEAVFYASDHLYVHQRKQLPEFLENSQ